MNVFEDLVLELKEADLLESTVIDRSTAAGTDADILSAKDLDVLEMPLIVHDPDVVVSRQPEPAPTGESDAEFFKKKAVGEVSSLQMVEHVITGVEREYLKIVPRPFDDLNVKKAISAFVNSDDQHSAQHRAAGSDLMAATEEWCSALAVRDREIEVTLLRQYCEHSRPALSSQALLGLGRFYRNLPYSEATRSKFDFIITRLFSRPQGQERRVCLFDREEMLRHINTLYSDWSSVSLYSVDDDDTDVTLTAMSFDDMAAEAEAALTFDELIESDFFGRLRMFKESITELFYAPNVTCAAILANIKIGNAYVELIEREREKLKSESLQARYADHDLEVSETTGKTLQLIKLLEQLDEARLKAGSAGKNAEQERPVREARQQRAGTDRRRTAARVEVHASLFDRVKENAFSVNKWVLILSFVMVTAAGGFYVWAGSADDAKPTTAGVTVFAIENTVLKEHLKSARISGDTLYAQVLPSWDALSREKRQDFLKKVYQAAAENGCKRVTLMGAGGKTVGYASATRIDVATP